MYVKRHIIYDTLDCSFWNGEEKAASWFQLFMPFGWLLTKAFTGFVLHIGMHEYVRWVATLQHIFLPFLRTTCSWTDIRICESSFREDCRRRPHWWPCRAANTNVKSLKTRLQLFSSVRFYLCCQVLHCKLHSGLHVSLTLRTHLQLGSIGFK